MSDTAPKVAVMSDTVSKVAVVSDTVPKVAVVSDTAPKVLFRASEAPWAYALKGRGGYVTDGPFLYRAQDGALLMLWSSFGKDGRYCIGTARSVSGALCGPWVQSEEPLYSGDGGHGMLFRGKDGKLYLAIHRPNKTPFERPVFLEAAEKGGVITVQSGNVISVV
jgi:hypothetical protein